MGTDPPTFSQFILVAFARGTILRLMLPLLLRVSDANQHLMLFSSRPAPWHVAPEECGSPLVFPGFLWRRGGGSIMTSWAEVVLLRTLIYQRPGPAPQEEARVSTLKDCRLPPPQIPHHNCVGVFEKGTR